MYARAAMTCISSQLQYCVIPVRVESEELNSRYIRCRCCSITIHIPFSCLLSCKVSTLEELQKRKKLKKKIYIQKSLKIVINFAEAEGQIKSNELLYELRYEVSQTAPHRNIVAINSLFHRIHHQEHRYISWINSFAFRQTDFQLVQLNVFDFFL